MSEPKPHPFIADYIYEISKPGIPYISNSHVKLWQMGIQHGHVLIQDLINQYFKALRAFAGVKP